MKKILPCLLFFYSITSAVAGELRIPWSSSQSLEKTPFSMIIKIPGGGGGNGPYKVVSNDELKRLIEERKEEIIKKIEANLGKKGYEYNKAAVYFNMALDLATQDSNSEEVFAEKYGGFISEFDPFGNHIKKDPDYTDSEFYVFHPGGGGGNGPYHLNPNRFFPGNSLPRGNFIALERGEVDMLSRLSEIENLREGKVTFKIMSPMIPESSDFLGVLGSYYPYLHEKKPLLPAYEILDAFIEEPIGGGGGGPITVEITVEQSYYK